MTVRTLALIAISALLATSCAKDDAPEPAASGSGGITEGGTLRIAGDGGPDSMNPYVATAQTSFAFFREIYPYMVLYTETFDDFRGDFATDWEVSPDGKVWTFHTQPDAKWSDDEPLTADDVVFTLETAMLPGSGWGGTTAHLVSAEAPDANTVVITYDKPVGNVLAQLEQMPIVPRHIWESAAKEGVKALKEVPDKAPIVGGGPWIMDEFTKDQSALFVPNPNWYGEKPIIDSWGVKFYEVDEPKIAALQAGEVDLIWYLPPSGVDPLKADGFEIDQSPGVEFHDIIFNSNPKPIKNELIKDPQVRLALEYALDRERLIETAQFGLATPGTTIVPPATGNWHNSSVEAIPYDPEKAKQILEEAGFTDGDGDGVRESPDGKPLEFTMMSQNGLPGINRVAEILKEDWGAIGVDVTQKPLAYNALWEANQAPINDKTGIGEYTDFAIILWDWVPMPDPDFILSVLNCDQLSVWSDTAYCDKQYDDWYAEQGVTVDAKKRRDIVWQMQEKIYNDRPYLVMYYLDAVYAHSTDWEGFVPSPQGVINDLNRDTLTQVHMVG